MENFSNKLASAKNTARERVALAVACLLIATLYASLADLKGIGTDEGFRLGIINGGHEFTAREPATTATWGDVLRANSPYAYQPFYFLIQNTVMRLGQTHDEQVLKFVNVFFLWLSLQGLLALSRSWAFTPRLFLLGLFSLNAYLLMHVLQVREYIAGIAFYVWSTWLVLHLDRRELGRSWADVGWFSAYGGLLAVGFFTQSWVVFPAIAQGIFLIVRRAGDRLRFYAHLAVSYTLVLAVTWPYLQNHGQKVNIGQWGTAGTRLWPSLADGFHLVLSGHPFGVSTTSDLFFWFWLGLLSIGAGFLFGRKFSGRNELVLRDYIQQSTLMLLCLALSVAFQIGYFIKVDTLSVWPRYFALHYFFTLWLVALTFKALHDFTSVQIERPTLRIASKASVIVVMTVMITSGIFQVRSYQRAPYSDTGMTTEDNWRVISAGLVAKIKPGDVVLTQDFIHAWTLTFTHPLSNEVLSVQKMGSGPFTTANRFVYLESNSNLAARNEIIARLGSFGFRSLHEEGLQGTLAWRLLIFERS